MFVHGTQETDPYSVLRTEVGIHFCLSGDDPDDPSHLIPKIRTQLAS
jgi:hypothetical protein